MAYPPPRPAGGAPTTEERIVRAKQPRNIVHFDLDPSNGSTCCSHVMRHNISDIFWVK